MIDGYDIATAFAGEIASLLDLPARAHFWIPAELGADDDRDADNGGGGELLVVAAPVSLETTVQDRGNNGTTHVIEVAFCKVLESRDDPEEVKARLAEVRRVVNLFADNDDEEGSDDPTYGVLRGKSLAGATWNGTIVQDPLLDRNALHSGGVFLAVPRFTFMEDNA